MWMQWVAWKPHTIVQPFKWKIFTTQKIIIIYEIFVVFNMKPLIFFGQKNTTFKMFMAKNFGGYFENSLHSQFNHIFMLPCNLCFLHRIRYESKLMWPPWIEHAQNIIIIQRSSSGKSTKMLYTQHKLKKHPNK